MDGTITCPSLFLFFSPSFPVLQVVDSKDPDFNFVGSSFSLDVIDEKGSNQYWTAGRLEYCSLVFVPKKDDTSRLSRIHFTIEFRGKDQSFHIYSGGSYLTRKGKLEYFESSVGVWVANKEGWIRVDRKGILIAGGERIWLGVNTPKDGLGGIYCATSPSPTIPVDLWEPENWPKDGMRDTFIPFEESSLMSEYAANLVGSSSPPATRWGMLAKVFDWLIVPPQGRTAVKWKIYLSLYFLTFTISILTLAIVWDLRKHTPESSPRNHQLPVIPKERIEDY
jgi:hypothetical protein